MNLTLPKDRINRINQTLHLYTSKTNVNKISKGECTSADDGGSSVDCGAGVYTCLIARTSTSSKVTHIFIFSYHFTICGVINPKQKARPLESLRKHSIAAVESLESLRAKD